MRLAISTTETLTDLKTDLVVANNNNVRNKQHTTTHTTPQTLTQTPNSIDYAKIKTNMKHIHTTIVSTYLNNRQHNKVTNTIPLTVHHSETKLCTGNPSYSGPTQNKQMSPTTLIFKQNRRSQTTITTMPSL